MKVGEKVKIKHVLREGCNYGGMEIETKHKWFRDNVLTIDHTDYENGHAVYYLEGIPGLKWTKEMFVCDFKEETVTEHTNEPTNNQTTAPVVNNNIDFSQVVSAIEVLTSKLDKRTLYDDSMQESVKKKVEDISTEELVEDINKKVDKHIKDTFGVLPTQRIEIINNGTSIKLEGIFHSKFEDILKIVQKGVPVFLTGPAGSGKNHTLEQVAKALGLEFYFSNAVTQEFKLSGFIDANGVYQETQFYKAFKDGGLFFLDEIDASAPEALITINAAIANGYYDFPCGRIYANENFRIVCAGNTYGTGADMIYVGRNVLDGATLDRFVVIEFDYDERVERQLSYDDELYNFINALRKVIKENSLRYIISMRATINATKLLEVGMDKKSILISTIIKNMQIDDLNIISNKINDYSEWATLLKEIINDRNK